MKKTLSAVLAIGLLTVSTSQAIPGVATATATLLACKGYAIPALAAAKTTISANAKPILAALTATYGAYATHPLWAKFIMLNCASCRHGVLGSWNFIYDNFPELADWLYQQKIIYSGV